MFNLAQRDISHLLSAYGYWAVLAFVGLESLGIPVPGETMLIAAAIYAGATHQLWIPLVLVAAATGAILGDNLGFLIGHWGGYKLLLRYGRYVRLDERKVKLARYLFLKHGGKVVFFGRFVSVLRTYAAFLAGTTRMPWRRFLAFNAGGGVVWTLVYGLGAYYFGKGLDRLSRPAELVIGSAAVIVVIGLAIFLHRNLASLEDEADRALPGPVEGYRAA